MEQRLIDAKAGKKLFCAIAKPAEYNGVIHLVVPISEIDKLPTVDAVEVVRCKDCVYCSTKSASRYHQLLRFCEWGDGHERVQSDGKFYCAHGKRRTEWLE